MLAVVGIQAQETCYHIDYGLAKGVQTGWDAYAPAVHFVVWLCVCSQQSTKKPDVCFEKRHVVTLEFKLRCHLWANMVQWDAVGERMSPMGHCYFTGTEDYAQNSRTWVICPLRSCHDTFPTWGASYDATVDSVLLTFIASEMPQCIPNIHPTFVNRKYQSHSGESIVAVPIRGLWRLPCPSPWSSTCGFKIWAKRLWNHTWQIHLHICSYTKDNAVQWSTTQITLPMSDKHCFKGHSAVAVHWTFYPLISNATNTKPV